MADLASRLIDRIHGAPALNAQESREFGPEKRKRHRHGSAYRGRRPTADASPSIPELRATTHVDVAPRPKEPTAFDRLMRAARSARETLVPDTPGEWAFEAASTMVPPAKVLKIASKLKKADMTTSLSEVGFRYHPEIKRAYEPPLREMYAPLGGRKLPSGSWPRGHHIRAGQWTPEEPGAVLAIPEGRISPAYSPTSGAVLVDKQASPFIIGHEAGHGLDIMGQRLDVPYNPRDRFPGDAEFARRKQLEAASRNYPYATETDFRRKALEKHAATPDEERASLLSSYLAFPDSVPLFSEFIEGELEKRGVDVEPMRRALQYPREALQMARRRGRRRR